MEEKEIKEAMIEALTHLEGCKYFVATIVNEEERRFDMSQRMSQHQYEPKNVTASIGVSYKRYLI